MKTIIICIAIAALITLFMMAIYKYSNDAMNHIMQVQSKQKWDQVTGLDGKHYWMPRGNRVRVRSTVK